MTLTSLQPNRFPRAIPVSLTSLIHSPLFTNTHIFHASLNVECGAIYLFLNNRLVQTACFHYTCRLSRPCDASNSVTWTFREVKKRTSSSLSNSRHCSVRNSLLFRFILLLFPIFRVIMLRPNGAMNLETKKKGILRLQNKPHYYVTELLTNS